jgi:hypothetical protein
VCSGRRALATASSCETRWPACARPSAECRSDSGCAPVPRHRRCATRPPPRVRSRRYPGVRVISWPRVRVHATATVGGDGGAGAGAGAGKGAGRPAARVQLHSPVRAKASAAVVRPRRAPTPTRRVGSGGNVAAGRTAAAAAGGSTQERMNELRKQLTRLKATTPRTVAAAAAATTRPRSRPPTPQRAARPRAVAPAQRAPSIPAPGQPPAQTVAAAAPAPTSSAAPPTRRNKKKSISFLRHDEAGPAVEFTDLQLTPRGGARNAHVSSLLLAPSPRSGPKPGDAPVRVPLLPAFCFSPADR